MARSRTRSQFINFLDEYIHNEYEINTAGDIEQALLDMFGAVIEKALEGEMENHLGFPRHGSSSTEKRNYRNGHGSKVLKTRLGPVCIQTPRDRNGTFQPEIVAKRQTDAIGIEDKVLALYGKGLSTRDISDSLKDIYQFDLSHEMISNITDKIEPVVRQWQDRPLKSFYPIIYLDAMCVPVKDGVSSSNRSVYSVIGIDVEGRKDVLSITLGDTEGASFWMGVLDGLKSRGVKDVCIACVDGLPGFKQAIQAVFPNTVVQRCIVHLVRQSTKLLPAKKRKDFCRDLRQVYQATSLEMAKAAFEALKANWLLEAPLAYRVWENNIEEVYQLFNFPQEIRKLVYTTNAIESYHSQLRKVTKGKGAFHDEKALMKLLYLRILDVCKGWSRPYPNWSLVLNQFQIIYPDRLEAFL